MEARDIYRSESERKARAIVKGEASTLDVVAKLLAVESHADIASEVLQLIGDRMRLKKELDELRSTLRKALG